MPVPLQVSKFKFYIIIYSLSFIISLIGSISEIPLLLDIGSLVCSCVLGIVSLAILRSAVSLV